MSLYWDQRAGESFTYRGEGFYTHTPVPFYYARRERLLALVAPHFGAMPSGSVLDFGCGDGYYLQRLSQEYPHLRYFGCDLSGQMLDSARQRLHSHGLEARLWQANGQAAPAQAFDIIYCFAVLAHIADSEGLHQVLIGMKNSLKPDGKLIVFEMTGWLRRRRPAFFRRREVDYRQAFEQAGLTVREHQRISYPFFELFDKAILLPGRRLIFGGGVAANRSPAYRRAAEWALAVSRRVDQILPDFQGNSVFVVTQRKLMQTDGP